LTGKRFRIIAHRCCGFGEGENSLGALRKALASSVDEIEVDYRVTKDRKLLLIHDARYTDAHGKRHVVRKETLAEARRNGRHSLEDALRYFARHGKNKIINIDIKDYGEEAQLITLIKKYHLATRIIIVSWLAASLERVHQLAPELPLSACHRVGIRIHARTVFPVGLARLPPIVRKRSVPLRRVNIIFKPLPVRARVIRRFQRRGLDVVVVNVDTVKGNQRLRELGALGTMTNVAPSLLREFKGS
jgi:glycerophosphoryl diester phosphodiesterase